MKLITVIPFDIGTAPAAERLCDWLYALNGKTQSGHCLLVATNEVHEEMRIKVQLAAEVAFESVDISVCAPIAELSMSVRNNSLFRECANKCAVLYRQPWILVEPDCVPLVRDWREQLAEAYQNQPKRYMGAHPKVVKDGKQFLSRVAVYPANAFDAIPFTSSNAPFEMASAETILPRSTKTSLIQFKDYRHEEGGIREDAVLLCADKSGRLITSLRQKLKTLQTA